MPKLPVLSGKKTCDDFKKSGFCRNKARQEVISMQKVTHEKTFKTIVPLHKEVVKGTLLDILHQTGLSKEDLPELLELK